MDYSLLESVKKIGAIANIGLLYAANGYDRERYQELHDIYHHLLHQVSGNELAAIQAQFTPSHDYPTAKVDVRGLVLDEAGRVLLVRESADGKWSLPGGWADIGATPSEVIVREFAEETGLEVVPRQLLAVFDKRNHPHPPQPFYVYKLVFYCESTGGAINRGFDVQDVAFFEIDALPELSTDRILESQIRLVYQKVQQQDGHAYFD